MSDESRVQQLIDEIRDSGRSPEEVRHHRPELLGGRFAKRWQQMSRVKAELHAEFPAPRADWNTETPEHRSSPCEDAGTHIGPYKLLQQIGEGGFGMVYMAEQDRPVRRRVALKIIKLGMDTGGHRPLRGGAAGAGDDGSSEHCQGIRRRRHRQRPALTSSWNWSGACRSPSTATDSLAHRRERLELFMQVCQAVQHAHQKGIIHRDLKPSNILVTPATTASRCRRSSTSASPRRPSSG